MTPVHFTALSMVDRSYFVDAEHRGQHAASKQTGQGELLAQRQRNERNVQRSEA